MFYSYQFLLFVGFITLGYANIPSYIHLCKADAPDVAECIKKSINELRPKLKDGIPELHVPGIEPLLLDEVKLRSGPSSAKIDANITNLKVWGPSSFEILELKPNFAKNKFIFKAVIPQLYIKGDYDIDMNILVLKYKGQGPLTGNFTNYGFDCIMKGKLIEKNGVQYLEFAKMQIRLTIGKSYLHLGELFPQDPTIARATQDVITDNSDLFVKEIKPALENSLAVKFTEIANQITTTFAYKDLFPKS